MLLHMQDQDDSSLENYGNNTITNNHVLPNNHHSGKIWTAFGSTERRDELSQASPAKKKSTRQGSANAKQSMRQ